MPHTTRQRQEIVDAFFKPVDHDHAITAARPPRDPPGRGELGSESMRPRASPGPDFFKGLCSMAKLFAALEGIGDGLEKVASGLGDGIQKVWHVPRTLILLKEV